MEATPGGGSGTTQGSASFSPTLPPQGAPLTLPSSRLCRGPTWSVAECLGLSRGSLSQLPRALP